ncbi:glycosyltransferase family 4 protein, partial [Acidisphaera rubrifaciens]|uniref:glycosyltransferase family 4 protein n=1 Tax=Acidisphaera rubrifaciens TaxID=50715 RepID=UPI0011DD04F1
MSRRQGLRTVHQFHAGSATGDAITNAMLLTRRLLRDAGYVSEIFVEHLDPALAHELHPLDALPTHADYVLIVRHSMGHDRYPHVAALPAPKVLIYHNVTPPALLAGAPYLRRYAELGRTQLAGWRGGVTAALADSDYNAIELLRLGFDPVATCTLLSDIDALRARAAAIPPARALRPFTVLFVGRVVPNKSQDVLVAAFAAACRAPGMPDDARLVLVGRHDGPDDTYVRRILAAVRDAGLGDRVVLTGAVSDDELHAWYARADLYVSLSLHEGYGVPLIEAAAHGVPVLAYAAGAVPYTLDGDAAALLDTPDPAAAGARIAALAA